MLVVLSSALPCCLPCLVFGLASLLPCLASTAASRLHCCAGCILQIIFSSALPCFLSCLACSSTIYLVPAFHHVIIFALGITFCLLDLVCSPSLFPFCSSSALCLFCCCFVVVLHLRFGITFCFALLEALLELICCLLCRTFSLIVFSVELINGSTFALLIVMLAVLMLPLSSSTSHLWQQFAFCFASLQPVLLSVSPFAMCLFSLVYAVCIASLPLVCYALSASLHLFVCITSCVASP